MRRRSIRGGMGLGDALYVQAIARHLTRKGESLKVCTAWPDVFRNLPVQTAGFTRLGVNIVAHYSMRKGKEGTTQFEDCCITAGVKELVDLRLDWTVTDQALVDSLLKHGLPVVLVQLPRSPMGRTDGFGAELLPDCRAIQHAIDALQGEALLVQVGHGEPLHRFNGIDVDLSGKTTVAQLLDIASVAHAFLGYVSFFVPLAESFGRPGLFIWSRRGLHAPHLYVRQITPRKVLHRPTSRHAFDDDPPDVIRALALGLLGPCPAE